MRIIGGRCKGKRIHAPKNLPVRPTTDFAKEALFNVLNNWYDFEGLKVLDLFAGTGNMSYEFASRGAESVASVDANFNCIRFIKNTAHQLDLPIQSFKKDVFQFLVYNQEQYDIVFADPPYDLEKITEIPEAIFKIERLKQNGVVIVEHPKEIKFDNHSNYRETKKYGKVNFSFFEQTIEH